MQNEATADGGFEEPRLLCQFQCEFSVGSSHISVVIINVAVVNKGVAFFGRWWRSNRRIAPL
jgi:hypothetical protein